MFKRRFSRVAVLVTTVGILAGACSSSATTAPTAPPASAGSAPSAAAPSAAPSVATQPYAGQTVVVNTVSGQEYTAFQDLLPDFEKQTGIKVSYNFIDPTTYQDKLPIQLAAHDSSFDVFFIGSENLPKYVAEGVVEPLDPYIQDTTKTPASWDYNDVLQTARDVCTSGGHVYCVGTHLGASMLFYNKKMFSDAGISGPPQSTDDVLADALKLTTGTQSGFCMRGDKTQNLLDPIYAWGYWLPYQNNVTGYWFDKDFNFMQGQSPYANQFGTWYNQIMTKAAPKGITTYLFSNCLQDLQQGHVAMWWDDSSFVSDLTDPTKSATAADLGYTEIPCATVNPDHCVVVGPWAGFINKNSTHKDAAWQVLQFLTGKQAATYAVSKKALANPVRTSVTQDPSLATAYPADYLTAVAYAGAHGNPVLLPFIPEGVAIIPPISLGLSELASNQGTVDSIMATMTKGVNDIMKKAGYPKPVPGVNE